MIHVIHQRTKYRPLRTPGAVWIAGQRICFSLEDELRELPGVPVAQWKVQDETAIPAGHYRVALVDSPHFGRDTLALLDVPGFTDCRVHAGNKEADTRGCPLMGAQLDAEDLIPGGQSKPGLNALRAILVPALKAGEDVIWDVRNPDGYIGPVAAAPAPAPAPKTGRALV